MTRKSLAMTTVLLLIFSLSLLAQSQSLNLSRKLNKIATSQKIAVAPDTGNILIVFNQLDSANASYSRVYSVLLKKKADGSYSKTNPRLISPDSGYHARPTVGYVASKKLFLVFWDNSDPAAPFGQASILGRWIKPKTGKARGGQFIMEGSQNRNVAPVLYMVRGDAGDFNSPPAEDGPFGFLFYTRYPIPLAGSPANELDRIGVYYSPLWESAGIKAPEIGGEVKIDDGEISGGYYLTGFYEFGGVSRLMYSNGIDAQYGGTFFGHRQERNPEGSGTITRGFARTVLFDETGLNYSQVARQDFEPRTLAMAKAFIDENGDQVIYLMVLRTGANDLLTRRITQSTMPESNATLNYTSAFSGKQVTQSNFIENVRLRYDYSGKTPAPAKPSVAWQISAAKDGWVYKRKIVNTGKPVAGLKKLFTHGNKIQSMASKILWYDESAGNRKFNSIVVWQKKISETKHELVAQLFMVD